MYTYQVLQDCFIGGVLRKPGDDRHGVFSVDEKIDPLPPHIKEVDPEKPEVTVNRKNAAEKLQKNVKKQQEDIKGASFLADPNANKSGGVETL